MKTTVARRALKNTGKPKANQAKTLAPKPLAEVRHNGRKFSLRQLNVKTGRTELTYAEFYGLMTKGERRAVRHQLRDSGVKFDPITYGTFDK